MKKILCIGEMLIDFFGAVPGVALHNQRDFQAHAGGAPANVASVAAVLGGHCSLLAAVGQDAFGRHLIDHAVHFGVHMEGVQRVSEPTTLAFVSVNEDGARDFIFNRGADAKLQLNEQAVSEVDGHDIIHFGAATSFLGDALETTYSDALKLARKLQKFIAFDPNYRSAFWLGRDQAFYNKCLPYLEQADWVKLSDEELYLLMGTSDFDQAIAKLLEISPAVVCVTLGPKGTFIASRDYQQHVAAPTVDAIDTTGAGDAFVGAVLKQLSETPDPSSSLRNPEKMTKIVASANAVAAKVCTAYGALTALKSSK